MPLPIVSATTPLHEAARELGGISVVTFNVLMPNSQDGWWVFKYYDAEVPAEARTWAHRHELFRAKLLFACPDVLCLQEASEPSFASDFAFLFQAGYDARLHRKTRFRPATFFRSDRFDLVADRHTDRALTLLLRPTTGPMVAVVNVHLSATPDPKRRFRQVFDALDGLRKELSRRGLAPGDTTIVVAGDFNGHPEGTGTDTLLRGGTVGPDFREPGHPDTSLSSVPRRHVFTPLHDAYRDELGQPPITLLGSRLMAYTPGPDGLPDALIEAIDAIYDRFRGEAPVLTWPGVQAWARAINGAERGSELRKAVSRTTEHPEPHLTRSDFQAIYRSEVAEGRFWSVQHDLQACGVATEPERTLFAACLDRVYHTPALSPLALWNPITTEQHRDLMDRKLGLPNAWHPSDHLPLGVVLDLRAHSR